MREIKFRAWREEKREMFYWEGTGLGQAKPHWMDEEVYKIKRPIMQFTGLKDKNGKDIYEGDIVKVGTCEESMEICFGNGCFWIKSNTNLRHTFKIFETECEVIGNKFENKELLE